MSYAQQMAGMNPSGTAVASTALVEYIEVCFNCAQARCCEGTCSNILSALGG